MPISLRCSLRLTIQDRKVCDSTQGRFENAKPGQSDRAATGQIEDGFGTGFEMLVVPLDQAISGDLGHFSRSLLASMSRSLHHPFYQLDSGWPSFMGPVDTRRQGRQRNARPARTPTVAGKGERRDEPTSSWPSACESLRHGPEGRKQDARASQRRKRTSTVETCGCFLAG